jgi:hypothetical protein
MGTVLSTGLVGRRDDDSRAWAVADSTPVVGGEGATKVNSSLAVGSPRTSSSASDAVEGSRPQTSPA